MCHLSSDLGFNPPGLGSDRRFFEQGLTLTLDPKPYIPPARAFSVCGHAIAMVTRMREVAAATSFPDLWKVEGYKQ